MFGRKKAKPIQSKRATSLFGESETVEAIGRMHLEDWKNIGTMEHAREVMDRMIDGSHENIKPPWEDD